MEEAPCDVMARGDRAILFIPYLYHRFGSGARGANACPREH